MKMVKKKKDIDLKNEDIVIEKENERRGFSSGNIKKLKDKIKKLEEEKKEYLDGWQRERAAMANLKKAHSEEKKLFTAIGKESLIQEIIPVLDSFDAAFSNKEAWEKVDSAWRSGVEYIYNQLKQVLENNGVEQFGEEGEDFDELKHLSVEKEKAEEDRLTGKVSKVIQRGYKSGNKILREAKVKVWN